MKKPILMLLVGVAAAAVMFSYFREDQGTQWTTESPEALEEFLLGQEARMRLYGDQAKAHFVRAAELDENFAVAKLMALQFAPRSEHEALLEEMRPFDVSQLRDHEKFLIEYATSRLEGEQAQATEILDEYLVAHPTSPWGLEAKAGLAWGRVELDEAEKLYKELLEADPNWVTAQNNLGYIAMGRGDFDEAEDHFMTYQYIAPDQANPHDSRGELLTLVGRYEEAWDEFKAALDIHPGFCASYSHQIMVGILANYEDRFPAVQEATRANCEEAISRRMDCAIELWSDYRSGRYDNWFVDRDDDCVKEVGSDLILHRMALLSGHLETAQQMESEFEKEVAELDELGLLTEQHPTHGIKLHYQGSRILTAGNAAQAAEKFRAAGEYFPYLGHELGILKLINSLDLALALELAGDDSASQQELQKVREVNNQLDGIYESRKQELARARAAT